MDLTPEIGGRDRLITPDRLLVLLSLAIQVALGLWFGHAYDTRIFMATGYLVGTGQTPYTAQDLSSVFKTVSFQGMTSVGYPPPWPLLLGLIYRASYAVFPNLLLYNLAIKVPIILANIGLASIAASILAKLGAGPNVTRKAWIFLLLSPFLFYFAAAWGQFDSIVALLSLIALERLDAGKVKTSAILLALAISLKPTALPILPVALVYAQGKSTGLSITYFFVCLGCGILFCAAPFIILGWDPGPILRGWNAQFTVGGGMSLMSFYELLKDSYMLPGLWWLLGLAWIPALGAGAYVLRRGVSGLPDLMVKSTGMILIFFLTRSWLSEPNIILILPFVMILTSLGRVNRLALAAVWILPLAFTIFNTSPPQLLFLSFPDAMSNLLKWGDTFRAARLVIRTALVIPWQIAGWWIVIICFRNRREVSISFCPFANQNVVSPEMNARKWGGRGG